MVLASPVRGKAARGRADLVDPVDPARVDLLDLADLVATVPVGTVPVGTARASRRTSLHRPSTVG